MLVTQRDGACVRCGSRYYLSAHHIQPRSEGGKDTPENLFSLCASCHARLEAHQRRD
jgi:5-methylcytosine-specific restriction endonuclease McrA